MRLTLREVRILNEWELPGFIPWTARENLTRHRKRNTQAPTTAVHLTECSEPVSKALN